MDPGAHIDCVKKVLVREKVGAPDRMGLPTIGLQASSDRNCGPCLRRAALLTNYTATYLFGGIKTAIISTIPVDYV